jgi:hypothetical protein
MKAVIGWPGHEPIWHTPSGLLEMAGEKLKIVGNKHDNPARQSLVVEREFDSLFELVVTTDQIIEALKLEDTRHFNVRVQENVADGALDFKTLAIRLSERLRAATEPKTEATTFEKLERGNQFLLGLTPELRAIAFENGSKASPNGLAAVFLNGPAPGTHMLVAGNMPVFKILE